MGISNVFSLLGGVAVFLFGMYLMSDGLKRVAGSRLEIILYKLTSHPLKGILLGTGVTAVIQSSSATSVMVVGFVNAGMMKVRQAIGIIMGAIIGTSVTGWIICLSSVSGKGIFELLSTNTLTTVVAVAGVILLMFTDQEKNHHLGMVFLGFAVLMLGITTMTDAVYPLRESPYFISLLKSVSNPFFGILIGLVFTCIIQSASAAVGLLQALAVTGAVSFSLALPVIMGIAIGASVPVLLSAIGANTDGKRTAMIYLLVDTLGALIFGILFYGIHGIVHFNFMNASLNMVDIALLNSIFRICIVILLMPFIGLMEKLVIRMIPSKDNANEALEDVFRLESRFLDHPALAIEQTGIAVNKMALLSRENVQSVFRFFDVYSETDYKKIGEMESVIDTYQDRISHYLGKIIRSELDDTQNKMVSLFWCSVNDFERIGDHAKNLSETAKEIHGEKIHFFAEASDEINKLIDVVNECVSVTTEAFISRNAETVYEIAALEKLTDRLCDAYKQHHLERIRNKECRFENGFAFNDMLTDLERIGDHCSNIAMAIGISRNEMSAKHEHVLKHEIEKNPLFTDQYHRILQKFEINVED